MNFFHSLLSDIAPPKKLFEGDVLEGGEIFVILASVCVGVLILSLLGFYVVKKIKDRY